MFESSHLEFDADDQDIWQPKRLTKSQKKQLKKVTKPTSIEFWPKNDQDDLVYVPYKIASGGKGIEKDKIGYIKTAFDEFKKHTRIR